MRHRLKNKPKRRCRNETRPASLRFTPTAWAKLLYLRDAGDTEVGGFGISAMDDLLLIEDLVLVDQICTAVTVRFDDAAVAEFFDRQIDAGLRPEQFGRIWIHTHPGHSAAPSSVDEETFRRVFGRSDWAVMAILARGGQRYARLQFAVGPGGTQILPFNIEFGGPFAGTDLAAWDHQYHTCVRPDSDTISLEEWDLFDQALANTADDAQCWPGEASQPARRLSLPNFSSPLTRSFS